MAAGARRRPLRRRDGRARPTTCARCGPTCNWGRGERVRGDEPLGYGEAAGALGEIAELDDLLDQLGQEHPGRDPGRRRRRGGRAQARPRRRRRRAPAAGAGAGAAPAGLGDPGRRRADAEPEGAAPARRHRAAHGSSPTSRRPARASTTCATPARPARSTGASRRWEFGDEQPLDVVRTIAQRGPPRAGAGGTPVPARRSRTSRWSRPSGGPRRRWRSASTCRSR